jgi:hypothetical protein
VYGSAVDRGSARAARAARAREIARAHRNEPDRYVTLLVLIILALLLLAGGQTWAKIMSVVVQGTVVVFALYTARANRRTLRLAFALVPIAVVLGVVGHASDVRAMEVLAAGISTLLPAIAIAALATRLMTHPEVRFDTVVGLLAIYLLVGITFSALYATIDVASDAPFFSQTTEPTRADFVYFSFITMTTVGYGDFTAAEPLPRMLAATQALIGQLYLVTVVAVAVTRVTRGRGPQEPRRPDDA